ncbi:uncharacterized protein Z519_06455 [Cladophialophora bantiana CBS 173.52]|uniref:ATP-dependent DNA ligase family profile domain-containing protein n=1 Tax=Cladophialophora bantiana (strain ATCC 10958 / CBS 173.52 / CDC B-1940 / NIH 8579) TaxID=1442370 RepID=A0A0D2HH70_CLAB1|nr:uncharacterized protein Z519_06455 [Cladophialophora bantiana CBS 173.52]KIW92608.1 hypothetical protein Z519_06455 [Cladophialophora bantiana CBS 173.52]
MPFKFNHLVQLLEDLNTARKQVQSSSTRHSRPADEIIIKWFSRHESDIVRHGPSAVAFLSCMLLDRVPNRVYGLREKSLASVLCKALFIENTSRGRQLHEWEATGLDFATCLEKNVMALAENDPPAAHREVTLEDIDAALRQLAANSKFASPEMRRHRDGVKSEISLRSILSRLHSREAKWFVRIIQRSYAPVQIPESLVLGCFHFLLPDILSFQNSIDEAVEVLGKPDLISIPHNPPSVLQQQYRQECARYLTPKLGVMVKRLEYFKARSIRHCCQMANLRTMSVERKYDGWYCQIHIDKSKGKECIQIFSKRGKDSTKPFILLHGALEAGLRLSHPECAITQNCILEGEMLVWSRSRQAILPFEKIRKYTQYGGRTIGAGGDSPRSSDEQLMIIFYDCLWHDNQNLVNEPHCVRRQHLEEIVSVTEGLAQLGDRREIRFGSASAKEELRKFFGYAIEQRWEGFVLKGRRDPYLSAGWHTNAIKLKKDYIKGLGDAADLCIIGGRKDPLEAEKYGGSLSWTIFYVACLQNKEVVQRFGTKPKFLILDILTRQTMSEGTFRELNQRGLGFCVPFSGSTEQMDVNIEQPGIMRQPPTVLFTKPFVVEVTGAAFTKTADVAYYALRFPRDVKLHFDRPLTETHSFEELQEMARESLMPADHEEQEDVDWILRLTEADGKSNRCVDLHAGGTPSPSCVSTASVSTCMSSPLTASRVDHVGILPTQSPLSNFSVAVKPDAKPNPKTASTWQSSPLALPANRAQPADESAALPPPINYVLSPGNGVKRNHEESKLPSVANKRPRKDSFKRLFIPLQSSLQNKTYAVHPYEPPAVFRSPTKSIEQTPSPFPISQQQKPLRELKNVTTKRGLEKLGSPRAESVDHGEMGTTKTVDEHVGNMSNEGQAPVGSAHGLDGVILKVMSFSALSPLDIKSVNWVTVVYAQLIDNVPSKLVRNTIYETVRTISKEYKRHRGTEKKRHRIARHAEDLEYQLQQPRQPQRRMILFYDEKIRSSFVDSSPDIVLKGAGDVLRKRQAKKYFAGALLMTAHEDTEDVVSRAIWDWHESVRLLNELRS